MMSVIAWRELWSLYPTRLQIATDGSLGGGSKHGQNMAEVVSNQYHQAL